MRKILFVTAFLSLGATCHKPIGPEVKIYVSDYNKGGAYRAQNNEVIKYEDTKKFRMISQDDWKALLNYCLGDK